MDYPEFRETIFRNVRELVPDEVKMRLLNVEKLNASIRFGILFTKENACFSPTIYLESFYGAYLKGEDICSLANEIVRIYNDEVVEPPECIYHLTDYNYVKDRIFAKLIHLEGNENLLKEVPFKKYLDFAIVPYYELDPEEELKGTILIKDKFLEAWEITNEELLNWAIQNTKEKRKVYFVKIVEFLDANLTEDERFSFTEGANQMYVLTNDKKYLGAVLIYYPEVLQMIRSRFGENYYLLPASIHEWIALPVSKVDDYTYLKWIVEEVNKTELLPEEFLSNNVYYYDSEVGKIALL